MARGMVAGEGIVSQAATEEFREGYARTFFAGMCRCGHDSHTHEQTQAGRCFADEGTPDACGCQKFSRAPQRGRWIWDAKRGRLVDLDAYDPEPLAVNAPIIADRIHEGTRSPIDGSDIGSRRKRREHMRAHGVEDATDVSPQYLERVKKQREVEDGRARRAAMENAARKLYSEGKWR